MKPSLGSRLFICRSFFVILFFLYSHSLKSQVGGIYYGDLIKQGTTKVELWLFPPRVTCGPEAGSWNFKLRTENMDLLDSTLKYLSWKMNTINCDGYLIRQSFRIPIESIQVKSNFLIGNSEWVFDARQMEGNAFDIKLSEHSRKVSNQVVGPKLFAPDSITGLREVTSDGSISLRALGPALPQEAQWVWYKDTCSGKPLFRGEIFTTRPGGTATYYVRSELKEFYSPCSAVFIAVNDSSRAADGIVSMNGEAKICIGSERPLTLRRKGGRLGFKAQWIWYANEIDPSYVVATGVDQIDVNPDRTTTYFLMAEGPKGKSAPVSFTVTAMERSIAPLEILREPEGPLCEGAFLRLYLKGGRLGEESKWVWSSIAKDGILRNIGNGSFISARMDQSAVFIVYGEGICGKTKEIYLDVELKKISVNPVSSFVSSQLTENGRHVRTTIRGGVLGDAAKWKWYRDPLGKQLLAEGNEYVSRSLKDSLLYFRAIGDCNKTDMVTYRVPLQIKERSFFLNAGWITNTFRFDSSNLSNFFVTLGTGRFYMKIGFGWPELSGNEGGDIKAPVWKIDGRTLVDYPLQTGYNYSLSGKIYPRLQTYTAGYLLMNKQSARHNLSLMGGIGYGKYDLFKAFKVYKDQDGSLKGIYWAKDDRKSIFGPAADAGLFFRWKRINVMGGVNAIYSFSERQSFISGFWGLGFFL